MRFMVWPATRPTVSTTNRINGTVIVTMAASRQPRKNSNTTTTEPMAIPRCSTSVFTALFAFAPSSRVTVMLTPSGMASRLSVSSLASTAFATTTALVPDFFAMAMVTAGALPLKAGCCLAGPNAKCDDESTSAGPSTTRATSLRNTGRPLGAPSTMSPTSRAFLRNPLNRSGVSLLLSTNSPAGIETLVAFSMRSTWSSERPAAESFWASM